MPRPYGPRQRRGRVPGRRDGTTDSRARGRLRLRCGVLADIESGKYGPGDPIPSEAELCKAHGVARETARRAVRVLRERGIVETEWGKGSRVKDAGPGQHEAMPGDGDSE
ncbi:winged helix-turn-helix transcriptional regulator [Streptomyces roseoverticillatus]|uniref:GntR family transcriptional regulator n=1 Tax=Streptomyces roseoverticillatus TaxID=66429 RepID=UPI001F32E3FF|nr:winged helix-turn-helix domain-containing protein [Streptomyces roseoverticillatus]MCF3103932.1 winged helix-turn-helix transcriptional regulator [Streptomyces roseoverticillatus]